MPRAFLTDLPGNYSDALNDIYHERKRQISKEGWSHSHDDQHGTGEMALAAATYAYAATLASNEVGFHKSRLTGVERGVFSVIRHLWPWDAVWFKPGTKRRMLVKAGALIVAEIERLDREAARDAA